MTNKDALIGVLDGILFSEFAINKALLDAEIVSDGVYSSATSTKIDLAAIELLFVAYTQPDITEGGFSRSHPDFLRKIEVRLNYLATKNNVTKVLDQLTPAVARPTVTSKSVW